MSVLEDVIAAMDRADTEMALESARAAFERHGLSNVQQAAQDLSEGIGTHILGALCEAYSKDAYRARVLSWFDEYVEQVDVDDEDVIQATFGLRAAVQEHLLDEDPWGDDYENSIENEQGARNRLNDFTWTPPRRRGEYARSPRPVLLSDTWEWDLKDYEYHFCFACWAIVWGVGQYRASKAEPVTV